MVDILEGMTAFDGKGVAFLSRLFTIVCSISIMKYNCGTQVDEPNGEPASGMKPSMTDHFKYRCLTLALN